MAKLYVFLALSVVLAHTQACECEYPTEEESKQVWETLMTKLFNTDRAVFPGLLSPLKPCGNCLDDGARRKRTIFPSPEDDNSAEEDILPKQDSRCPVGYGRVAFRCINLSDLYK